VASLACASLANTLPKQGSAVKTEYTSNRNKDIVIEVPIEGEVYTLRPKKKAKVMLGMMKPDLDIEDPMAKPMAAPRALLSWFWDALDGDHLKTKKKPGHDEPVEGCQACRIWDRLHDEDDNLEVETLLEVANDLYGEVADRPTG
jgi:hypothetical protein